MSEYQERYNEPENCSATVEEACSNFTIPEDVSITLDGIDKMVRWRRNFFRSYGAVCSKFTLPEDVDVDLKMELKMLL